jgi:hypothetical protein
MDEPRSSGGQAGFLIANNPRGRCARQKTWPLAARAQNINVQPRRADSLSRSGLGITFDTIVGS